MNRLAASGEVAATVELALGSEILIDDPEAFPIDGETPVAVAQPASVEELSELLRIAAAEGWAVVPAGLGTWLHAGGPLRRADLVITSRRLDRLREHRPDDLLATAEAGITLPDLAAALAERGQFCPLDPPGGGSLGAAIATACSGPLASAYGGPRDLVLGLEVALADGRIVHYGGEVVKNVAGYDMVKLLTGSWGTLGFIVAAHLRLYAVPPEDQTQVFFSETPRPLASLAGRLATGGTLPPVALEIVSPPAADALGVEAGEWQLAARWLGGRAAVETASAAAQEAAGGLGLRCEARRGFWEKLSELEAAAGPAIGVRMTVPRSATQEAVAMTRSFAGGQTPIVIASPVQGRVWIYISRAMYEGPGERLWALRIEELRRDVAGRGGSVRVERAPPELRRIVDAWGDPGPTLRLHRALKKRFDPNGRLNPGLFVGGL